MTMPSPGRPNGIADDENHQLRIDCDGRRHVPAAGGMYAYQSRTHANGGLDLNTRADRDALTDTHTHADSHGNVHAFAFADAHTRAQAVDDGQVLRAAELVARFASSLVN